MGLKRVRILLILVIAGSLTLLGWNALGLDARLDAMGLVRSLLEQDRFVMNVELEAGEFLAEGSIFRDQLDGDDLFGLTFDGRTVYYWEESLYLDNGRGYDAEELLTEDWKEYLPFLMLTQITYSETESTETAEFRITEELLSRIPREMAWAEALEGLTLRLTGETGGVQEVVLSGKFGTLRGVMQEQAPPKPDTAVLMEMKAGRETPIRQVLPLVRSCIVLGQYETVGTWADLELSCGLLPIRDRADLYYTDGKLILVRGGKGFRLNLPVEEAGGALFPALGYLMLRDGEYIPTENGLEFRLTIPADSVKELFDQVLPEAAGLGLEFEEAQITLTCENDRLTNSSLRCEGKLPFLITRIPIGFSMDLTFQEAPVTLPEAALEALSRG